jgi:hypothetical protein
MSERPTLQLGSRIMGRTMASQPESSQDDSVHPYADLIEIVGRYWVAYGGFKEVGRSPFTHLALVMTVLAGTSWSSSAWQTTALGVLPNLLGFGVTGYAIWIGWGDSQLRRTLSRIEMRPGVTAYAQVSATFAHFALVQVAALVWALMFSTLDHPVDPAGELASLLAAVSLPSDAFSHGRPAGAAIGFFLFVYAILVALEATLALFRLATWPQIGNE